MIQLYTDTSANLRDEWIAREGIRVLPLTYILNGRETNTVDEPFDDKAFYNAMRAGAVITTSMLNEATFREAFEKCLSEGDDVLYVGMSGGISGTFQAAFQAVEWLRTQYPQRKLAAINTRCASLGEGLPVLYAARLIREGLSFDEIVEKTEENCQHMCQFFTVEDLRYLQKGGRISKAGALVGNILSIKPILRGDLEGRIVLYQKIRGRQRALDALVAQYKAMCSDHSLPVGIAHGDCLDEAESLARALHDAGMQVEPLVVCYEPVTGSHVGPGTMALFFYGERK